jgi:hypothetical protein
MITQYAEKRDWTAVVLTTAVEATLAAPVRAAFL